MTSEKEMLLAGEKGRSLFEKPRRRGRWLKRVAVGALLLVVVLAAAVALLGPRVAAALVPARSELTVAGRPAALGIRDVELSWMGPQKVGEVTLDDASGRRMATLRLDADTSLVSVLFGSRDFGTLRVSGDVSVKESQLTAAAAPSVPPLNPPLVSGGPAAPAGPIVLPNWLSARIVAEKLAVSYTRDGPGGDGGVLSFAGLNGTVDYKRGTDFSLSLTSASPAVSISVVGTGLADARGALTLDRAQVDADVSASLDAEMVESLARVALSAEGSSPAAVGARGGMAPLTLAAAAQLRGGRLKLASASKPIILQTGVPRAAAAALSKGGAAVALTRPPVLTVTVGTLDVPLAAPAGAAVNWGTASVLASVATTETAGTLSLDGAGSARSFTVAPLNLVLDGSDLSRGATLNGGTTCTLDGQAAGSIEVSARAEGLVGQGGGLVHGLPGRLEGSLTVKDVPTALLEPLARAAGVPLRESLGDAVNLKLTAMTREAGAGGSAAPGVPPETELTAEFVAPEFSAYAIVIATPDRVRGEGKSARFEGRRVGPIARALLAGRGVTLEGDGLLIGEVNDLDVPLVGGMPDLGRAAGRFRVAVGALSAPGLLGERTIDIDSLDTEVRLKPAAPIEVAIDHRLKVRGQLTRATGTVQVADLIKRRDGEWPWLDVNIASARPSGTIEVDGLPADLWGLAGERLGTGIAASLGSSPKLVLTAAPAAGAGATTLDMKLTSAGADGGGVLTVDGAGVRSEGAGLGLVIKDPGPMLAALGTGEGGLRDIRSEGPLELRVSGLSVARPKAGEAFSAANVEARASIKAAALSGTIVGAEGAKALSASGLDVTAANSRADGASVSISSKGSYGGEAFGVEGSMALGRLTGADGRVSLASVAPKGTINATRVPVSLLALFVPEYAGAAGELLGETADLSLTAPAPGSAWVGSAAPSGPSAGLVVQGARLRAQSAVAIEGGKTVKSAITTIDATLTPKLVEVLGAKFAPQMNPRPGLAAPAAVNVMVQPVLVDLGEDLRPNMKTLRPLSAMVLGKDDLVITSLPGGAESKTLSAGLRGLTVGVRYDAADLARGSEASLRTGLFDPADPGSLLLSVDALSGLQNPPAQLDAKLSSIDTARMDRWLGRPGLLADALGKSASATVHLPPTAGAGARAWGVAVSSERLNTAVSLVDQADRVALELPAVVAWQMPEAWANRYLAPAPAAGRQQELLFEGATGIRLELTRLSIAKGEAPMKPGVFALEASASAPAIGLKTAAGDRLRVSGLSARVNHGADPGEVGFSMSARSQRLGTEAAASEGDELTATGRLTGLSDSAGRLNTAGATLTADIKGSVPTAVLDALAKHDGLLVDLLGPTTEADLRVVGLTRDAGTLSLVAMTDYTDANVRGARRPGVFATDQQAVVRLREISPGLSNRALERVLPIISRVSKTAKDEPAVIGTEGLELPTDGDLSKLNGVVRVDLGTVQFQTSSFFGELLKATKQKTAGRIGDKIKPFEFTIRSGVVSYDRIEVPIGEFSVVTRGTIDLVQRKLDVLTFVPFYAVADELAGVLGKTPGLDRLAMVPIRTKGSFDGPKSELDLTKLGDEGLIGAAKGGVEGILQGVGGLLEGLDKKKQEDKEKKKKKKEQQQQQQPKP